MKNKKGFIFIETIIVTAVLLASLMLVYSLYVSSLSSETIRLRYDDPAKLYETFYVKKYLESFDLDVLKERIDNGEPYQMIYRGQSDVFGSSYTSENVFFENLWMELNIKSIMLIPHNVTTLVECEMANTAGICSNPTLLGYLRTLDDGEEGTYRLVIEYSMNASGESCTSTIGCFSYYASVKVGA